jgi:hypothetical protein
MTDHDDTLDQLRALYEGKNQADHKAAIPTGLAYCIANNLPIPPWLGTAFCDACRKVSSYDRPSWNDVFGEPVLKGQRLYTLRRNSRIREPLWKRIQERRAAGAAITKELFAEVGAEFGLGATVASDIYYENKELFWRFWQEEGASEKV